MKDAVLLELANRWEKEAETPKDICRSEGSEIKDAIEQGRRDGKRECADGIRMLISILGEHTPGSPNKIQ